MELHDETTEAAEDGMSPFPALTTMVADNICKLIQDRHLNVLDKIPPENELARLFHVGRGTIREAEKLLVSKNILEIRRGTGTFVCEKKGVVDDPFGFTYAKDKTRLISDLHTIRMILEPETTYLAAQFVTDEEIAEMEDLASRIEILSENKQDFCAEDIAFHTLVAQSSRNTVMPTLIPVIHYGIEWYNRSLGEYERKKALGYHRVIIEAFKCRDPEMAKSAMHKHLSYNKKNLERVFEEQSGKNLSKTSDPLWKL